jgi:adenylosuccinate lyase
MEQTRIRFWQGVSLALALALAAMAAGPVHSVFAQSDRKQRFTEIDVERINIREADGTVKLVIANRERAPDRVSEASRVHALPADPERAGRSRAFEARGRV